MKKILLMTAFVVVVHGANAQAGILEIIKAGIVKVIKAVDLKIQRLQNKTIWLQNAQKTLENKMAQLKLDDISGWIEKQRKLYADYYDELWKIKVALAHYQKVRDVINKQVQIVTEYSKAYNLSKKDQHFTVGELDYMRKVYDGIIDESLKNIEELQLVINAYSTQMNDARRLEVIQDVSDRMEETLANLRSFNQHNIKLSLQRAKEKNDIDVVKKLYGIQ